MRGGGKEEARRWSMDKLFSWHMWSLENGDIS